MAANDRAGPSYWEKNWSGRELPTLWGVGEGPLSRYPEVRVFEYFKEALEAHGVVGEKKTVVEVGCARSAVLPLFKMVLGLSVEGIDYSTTGCEQARAILKREGVDGRVICCDFLSPPDELTGRYDAVVSFGLVEHFTDSAAAIGALSALLRPGGVLVTNVPNMLGTTGWLQRILDRTVFDVHEGISLERLRQAHLDAGLTVERCGYVLPVNYGVCNINSIPRHSVRWWTGKVLLAVLVRVSMVVWWVESLLGKLPVSRAFSPYLHCVARKATTAG